MVTLTAFEGSDPTQGERRTMTIGRVDPAELATDVGRWAHDVTARMLAGSAPVDIEDTEDADDTPQRPAVPPPFVETTLWADQ